MPIDDQLKTCQIRLRHPTGSLPAGTITTATIKAQGSIVTATINHAGSTLQVKQVAGIASNFEFISH